MADSGQAPSLYEVGGSVIHPRNRLMLDLVEKAGLKAKPTPKGFDPSEDTRSGGNKQLYFLKPIKVIDLDGGQINAAPPGGMVQSSVISSVPLCLIKLGMRPVKLDVVSGLQSKRTPLVLNVTLLADSNYPLH